MRKGMKINKGILLLLILTMILGGTTAYAGTDSKKTEFPRTTLSDDVILSLSLDDLEECNDLLNKKIDENPDIGYDELNKIAANFYIRKYKLKEINGGNYLNGDENKITPKGIYDEYLIKKGLNSQELELAKKYPADLAGVRYSAEMALAEAQRRYNSGEYLGNQDSFRHTAWNALMVQRFYRLGKGSVNTCMARVKIWTDAHEYGAPIDYRLTSSQRSSDRSMDLLNNAAGRAISETNYNSSEYDILQRVQYYVDNGWCQRISTDSQTTYNKTQMLAISNWTLKPTNTVGKK